MLRPKKWAGRWRTTQSAPRRSPSSRNLNFRGLEDFDKELVQVVNSVPGAPDGTKLAYIRWEGQKACDDIRVMDIASGVETVATPQFLEYRCFYGPKWSPDSKKLAFLGYFSRGHSVFPWPNNITSQLYVAELGSTARRVTNDLKATNGYGVSWCEVPIAIGSK
jgi:hypothetical protein